MASASARGSRAKGKSKTQTTGIFSEIQHKGAPHKLAPIDHMVLMPLLRSRDVPKLLNFSATYYFNHELWLNAWQAALGKSDFAVIKSIRLFVQLNSIHASNLGAYFLPDGSKVTLPKDMICKSVQGTQQYNCAPVISTEPSSPLDTSFQVVKSDCLVAALDLVSQGLDPAVLVLASAYNPGGGYMEGAGAQEENLCRRTTLWQNLMDPFGVGGERKWVYPIPEFGAIYSPKVLVFRGEEKSGYAYLAEPVRLGFINSCAYRDPPVQTGKAGETRLSGKIIGNYLNKIRAIFSVDLLYKSQLFVGHSLSIYRIALNKCPGILLHDKISTEALI
ncbi:hypothetical protein LOD99_10982 [Oopsacas minuta]|uniref:Microbial-type PARG catalytic domain-containing protein n=1 Tax=Oopsacas minuta TaxID=111878 RepID=A0AAV7KB04_9METZ|nr:hypothetical protein LOD99_10982 [Oopsacas minuta]